MGKSDSMGVWGEREEVDTKYMVVFRLVCRILALGD